MADRHSSPNILLVCDKPSFAKSIRVLLQQHIEDCRVHTVASALQGRKSAREEDYDMILVNSPLEFDLGVDFVKTLVKITYASIIILTPSEIVKEVREQVAGLGVLVLGKPLRKDQFTAEVDSAYLASRRTRVIYVENVRLKKKIRELKVVDRAKVLLVEYLKLSEEQAHKYIEQQAMELRKSRAEIAQSIINTYQS